jgi:PAS domain S-box-containing protein
MKPDTKDELRNKAEDLLREHEGKQEDPNVAGVSDALALVHELQVHQIELVMQNEELKQAKLEAEAALTKYSDLYDFAPLALFTLDKDGLICEVNLAGAELLGMERRYLLNRRFEQFVVLKDRTAFDTFCREVNFSELKQKCELCLLKNTGEKVQVFIEGKAAEEPSLEYRLAIMDITERKRAEEALKESESILHSFFDSPGVMRGIVEVVSDDDIRHIADNEVTAGFLGLTPEEMKGKLGSELGEPQEVLRIRIGHYRESQSTGKPVKFEYMDPRGDNETWLSATVNYLGVREGRPRFAHVIVDISDRKRAEKELREAKDNLEVRVRERTEELEKANALLHDEITSRMKAEKEVRAERKRFNDVLEKLPAYLVLLTADYHVPFANRFFRERFGESHGRRCFEHLFGRSEPCENCETYKVLKTNKPHRWEWTGPDGRNYDIFDFPFTDSDGSSLIMEMGIDITERKQAEEALKAAGIYNRSLIEASLDPLVTIGPDGKITDVNEATIKVTGVSREQIIGTDFSDYFTEPEKAREGYQQVFAEGSVTNYPLTILDKNGKLIDVLYNASIFKDGQGNVLGVFAAARDITERRRAEIELDHYRKHLEELVRERTQELAQALSDLQVEIIERKHAEEEIRRSEERFRSIFESTQEAIIIIDNDMRCINANPGAGVITGIPHDQLVGKFLPDFINPGFDLSAAWPVFKNTGRFSGEVEIRYKDGTYRTVEATGRANILPDQHLFVGYDITERMIMEKELRRARDDLEERIQVRTADLSDAKKNLESINEELQAEISEHEKTEKELLMAKEAAEAAVEAKAAFLANMSHELRTPLNAVIGYSSLLLDDNLTEEQREGIESIKSGGEALLAIISEILEFSRAEKEKIILEHQPFSLKRCIEDSMDMLATQASQKGLNLSYTIFYGTPDTIIGDPGRLRQILVNLLGNAVKFTDSGEVSVLVSSELIEANKRQILFEVKDTGIGMPQDKMDRIFEPFTQLEYVMSLKRDGAGLGLAISKKIVELMGGEIWAESEEGKGSTFRFTIQAETLPGERLDICDKDRVEYKDVSEQKPLSILVAEDNPSNQKVLVDMLKRLGYRPDAVADGAEVIQALVIRHYDLIFMDVRMPEMDGLTAAKEIRKLWPNDGPTIIAITAYAMEGDQKMCLEAGMDGYIAKPVKLGDLAEVISRYQLHENSP